MAHMNRVSGHCTRGISLLELALVLIVLALLVGGILKWQEWTGEYAPTTAPHPTAVSPRST
jgi:hypothetical protein